MGSGCNERFDKTRWTENDDPAFPPVARKYMINDLIASYKLKGLKYNDVVALLGNPNGTDSNEIFYNVDMKYDVIDPVYVKSLIINFKDSVVTSYSVQVWEK